jgi:hypothetical protein
MLQFAVNTSINSTTNFSPHYLFFNRKPILPIEVHATKVPEPKLAKHEYIRLLNEHMSDVFDFVNKNLNNYVQSIKEAPTQTTDPAQYQVSNMVLRLKHAIAKGKNKKFLDGFYPVHYVRVVNTL